MIACGTGQRPQHLPSGFDRYHPWKLQKLKMLEEYLKNSNIDTIISGGAIGFDQYLMFVSIKLNIQTFAYLPFKGQESKWSPDHQKQYHKLLERCTKIKYICSPGYAAWKMHRRNEAMLQDSELVLALWNPEKRHGGTFSTIATASSMHKPILNFYGDKVEPVNLTYETEQMK
jgi:uncharacterized phage-like protein YoqJ